LPLLAVVDLMSVRGGLLIQALHLVAGGALLLLSLSKGASVNKFAVLSVAAGFVAIVVGELGDIAVLTSVPLVTFVLIFPTIGASSEENLNRSLQLFKS
jgi:hypothetical protein